MKQKKWKDDTPAQIQAIKELLEGLDEFKEEVIENAIKEHLEANELSFGQVLPNLRLLLVGGGHGPSVPAVAELIGKEETVDRIENGLKRLANG